MALDAKQLLAKIEEKFGHGEILGEDYDWLRLALMKEVRLSTGTAHEFFPAPEVHEITDAYGTEFCLVEAGSFLYGPDDLLGEVLAPYYISKYPVTAGEFMTFLEDSGYDFPAADLEHLQMVSPSLDCPVCNVSFDDAKEYCRWRRKCTQEYCSLPHDFEWERAARGIDGRLYPWGDEDPSEDYACYQGEIAYTSTVPAATFSPNISPCGCIDMVGNVWEWCLDSFVDERDPHIMRGGAWAMTREYVNCLGKSYSFPPDKRIDSAGFRIVHLPHDLLLEYRQAYAEDTPGPEATLGVAKVEAEEAEQRRQGGGLEALDAFLDAAVARAGGESAAIEVEAVVGEQEPSDEAPAAPTPEPKAPRLKKPPPEKSKAVSGTPSTIKAKAAPPPKIGDATDNLAQIISNASNLYLQSKKGPAKPPAAGATTKTRVRFTTKSMAAKGTANVEIVDPTKPMPDDLGDDADDHARVPTSTEALPVADLGQLDEAGEKARSRARRTQDKVKNSPIATYAAFAIWCALFIAALCFFIRHVVSFG